MGILEEKLKKEQRTRRRRRIAETQEVKKPFDYKKLGNLICFLLFVVAVVLVCFVGRASVGSKLLLKQMAKTRVVADFPFSYHSTLKTEQIEEQRRQMVPPVYRVDKVVADTFTNKILTLAEQLNQLQRELGDLSSKEKTQRIKEFTKEFSNQNSLNLNKENIATILERTNLKEREYLFSEALLVFKETARRGIYNPSQLPFTIESDGSYFSNIEIDGQGVNSRPRSEEEALKIFRANLSSIDMKSDLSKAFFHVLKNGLVHNLTYDVEKSEARVKSALSNMEPVLVHVSRGQTIVEPDNISTPEEYEMLNAYIRETQNREGAAVILNAHLITKFAVSLLVLTAALIYVSLVCPKTYKSTRQMLLIGFVIILSLSLNRIVLHLEESSFLSRNMSLLASVPYAVPLMFGPVLASSLLGVSLAIMVSGVMSAFNALMQGSDISWFFIYLLACFVAVYFSQNVRLRMKLVKASMYGGCILGACAVSVGIYGQGTPEILVRQLFFAILAGIVSGGLAVGILPFFQNIFKKTTDIRLLELIDFNHPLLKRLQIEAPGTYHHSLMVATLAERAAAEIGANSLACRACALFHDIGKLVKPEYFVENQRDGVNPHTEKNPSMSALIIKSHVKEGLEMAKEARLPQIILDVILQHHGTTLIQYFYTKAVRQRRQSQDPFSINTEKDADVVDESIFRYDGPRPQFKESAIIFFADSIEAASRSLKKVTPQSVQELISTIFQERIDDLQLDESPLTMQEISQIKASFTFTLLNMMHSRVEYPKDKK